MQSKTDAFFCGMFVVLLAWSIWLAATGARGRAYQQRCAVEAGHGHYDALTGEFRWNEPCGPQPGPEESK